MPAEPSHTNTPLQQHRDERRSRSNSRSRSRNPSRASGVPSSEPPPPVPPLGPEWSTETPHRGRRQTPHSRGRSWRLSASQRGQPQAPPPAETPVPTRLEPAGPSIYPGHYDALPSNPNVLPASSSIATSTRDYTQLEQELLDWVVQRGANNDSAENPNYALQYSPSRPEFVGEEARRLQRESYEWFNSPAIPPERVEPIRLSRPSPTSQLGQQLHAPLPPIMPNNTDDNYPAERFEDTEFVPATLQDVLGTPAADFQRHGPSTAFPDPGHNAPAPVSRRAREAHSTGPGSSRIRPHRSTPEFRTQAGSWASMASGSAKGHERYWEAQSGPGVRTTAAGGEVDPLDRPNYPIAGTGNEYTTHGAPAPELEPRVAGPSGPRIPVTSLMAPPPSLPRTLSSPALTPQGGAPGVVPAGRPTLPPILAGDGSTNVTTAEAAGSVQIARPSTSIAGPVAGPSAQAATSGRADGGPSAQEAVSSAPPVGPSGSFACPATAFPRPTESTPAAESEPAGSETPSREREAWEALMLAEVRAQRPHITEAHNAVVNDTLYAEYTPRLISCLLGADVTPHPFMLLSFLDIDDCAARARGTELLVAGVMYHHKSKTWATWVWFPWSKSLTVYCRKEDVKRFSRGYCDTYLGRLLDEFRLPHRASSELEDIKSLRHITFPATASLRNLGPAALETLHRLVQQHTYHAAAFVHDQTNGMMRAVFSADGRIERVEATPAGAAILARMQEVYQADYDRRWAQHLENTELMEYNYGRKLELYPSQLAAYEKDKQAKDEKYAQDMETYNRERAAALEAREWEKKHGVKDRTPLPPLPRRPAHKDPPKEPVLAIDPKPKDEPPTFAPLLPDLGAKLRFLSRR